MCVATEDLPAGEEVVFGARTFSLAQDVPRGHKICVQALAVGEKVVKYGASIGSATRAIGLGEHVHAHNLASDYLPADGRKEDSNG